MHEQGMDGFRDVAQPGSALRSGRRGRRFESCHPDQRLATSAWRRFLLFERYASGLPECEERKK
jgi:hypothetical protein